MKYRKKSVYSQNYNLMEFSKNRIYLIVCYGFAGASLIVESTFVYEDICEVLGPEQQPCRTAKSSQDAYRLYHTASSPKILTPVIAARRHVPHPADRPWHLYMQGR